ncbi:hypothetical protein Tco_0337538 [Tanacetum coccineum]
MTMHEVVQEMVARECHEPNSERSGSAWKVYMNARVPGLFLLVLLEYPKGKSVVRAMSRGLDMALHWSGVGAAPLMSPRQDETSEPLLYAGWMVGLYRYSPVWADWTGGSEAACWAYERYNNFKLSGEKSFIS